MSIDSHEFSVWIQAVLEIDRVARKSAWKIFRELPDTVVDRKSFAEYASAKSETESRMPGFGADQVMERFSEAEELLDKTRSTNNGSVLNFRDFPTKLREMDDPPLLVHCLGDSSLISSPSVAVIGTREPTGFGSDAAIEFGKQLAENGQVVVSGLALGCDTGGHEGCLEADGKTIAVLAHGLDTMFPKENRDLAISILSRGGLLLSEYKFGVGARGHQFVERDRIQAALSDAVIVVETGVEGGTLHTVGFAEKNDVPVFALDHPPEFHEEDQVKGNRMLLEDQRASRIDASAASIDSMIALLHSQNEADKTKPETEESHLPEVPEQNAIQSGLFPVAGVIFDLDQTLVDTSLAETKRKSGDWSEVYDLIPHFQPYEDMVEILTELKKKGLKICVVTSSPSVYCDKVLSHFNMPCDCKVCYHDTEKHKPEPEPFSKALDLMGLSAEEVVAFGDSENDVIGASRAGITSVACTWGLADERMLASLERNADIVLQNSAEIMKCIGP